MSILILFGAGASNGAGSVYPNVPPLGKYLYRELEIEFPRSWGSIPESIKSKFNVNFEDGMNVLWNSGSHAIPILMQHMAIFFSKYQLSKARNDSYSIFLDNILRSEKEVRYSSLNYDCLFEIAASMAGKTINYFHETSASDSDLIIWKLHGSCNFLPEGGITATRGVSFSSGVSFSTGVRAANLGEVPSYCLGDTSLYPIMAVYAQGKPVQIATDIIKNIQSFWAKAVSSSEIVVIIGINPHPPDGHIWGPLAETNAKILYVGNNETFSAWVSEYRSKGESIYLGDRFSTSIRAIMKNI